MAQESIPPPELPALPQWPPVPETFRPRELPHDGRFSAQDCEILKERGYEPLDVRFLSGQHAVAAFLAGGRLGTVTLSRMQLEVLELEAKVYGLTQAGRRNQLETAPKVSDSDREAIFLFFNERRMYGTSLPDPRKIPREKGRKKWSKDKSPRTLTGRALFLKQKGEEYRARKAGVSGASSTGGEGPGSGEEPSVREWFDLTDKAGPGDPDEGDGGLSRLPGLPDGRVS